MKTFCNYLKQKKLAALLSAILLFILFFHQIIDKAHVYLDYGYDRQSGELARMINSVIGIPYNQKPQYKNNSPDILRLTKEEWYNIPNHREPEKRQRDPFAASEGGYTYKVYNDEIEDVFDTAKLGVPMPSTWQATHAYYLEFKPIIYRNKNFHHVYHGLCDHVLTCKSLNISVKEYVLSNPQLLEQVIKIAQRPCDYIRTLEEIKPGDEMVYYISDTGVGKILETFKYDEELFKIAIKRARECLSCDHKDGYSWPSFNHPSIKNRKLVLLVINKEGIVKNDGAKNLSIIIERKDI